MFQQLNDFLGDGFKDFGIFIPKFGEDEPILTSIFFKVETTNELFLWGKTVAFLGEVPLDFPVKDVQKLDAGKEVLING